MSVTDTTGAPQDGTEGQAPVAGTTAQTAAERVSEVGSVDSLPKWAQGIITDLRKENADRRKKETDRERQEREAEEQRAKQQGEWQKLAETAQRERDEERQRAETERTARLQDRAHHAVQIAARDLGFTDPDDAFRFIETGIIEWDANDRPTNVKPLLERLAKEKPYLLGGQQQNGNAAIPRTPNGTTITRDQFHQQERERALRSGRYSAL
jgi:hypothetical protein